MYIEKLTAHILPFGAMVVVYMGAYVRRVYRLSEHNGRRIYA